MYSRTLGAIASMTALSCATQIDEELPPGHGTSDGGMGGSVATTSGGTTASGGNAWSGGMTSGGTFATGGAASGGVGNITGGDGGTGGITSGSGGNPPSGGTVGAGGTPGVGGSGATGGFSASCAESTAMLITTPATVAGTACVKFSVQSTSTGLQSRTGAYPVPFKWWSCTASGADTFTTEWQQKTLSPTASNCMVVIQFEGGSAQFSFQWWAN